MDLYLYDGPVMEFEKVICNRWVSKTWAQSAKKAKSNLTYQFKKQFNKAPSSKITLPGKITCLGQEEKIS